MQYQLSERADDINSNNSKGFGYLGRIDSTRLFSNEGSLEFYPGKFSKSESGKVTFMKRIVGILNIYTRPHAQSGVTPDALSFRKFVAVCDNDAWADYDWGGYMCVFKGHSESIILSKFQEYVMKAKVDDSIFEATFSECFGKRSINHWICAIES